MAFGTVSHTNLMTKHLLTVYLKTDADTVSKKSYLQTVAALLVNNSQNFRVLHVASVCTLCFTLLSVAGSCFAKYEAGQTPEPTTLNISFVP